jgi:hypothetical protein
MVTLGLQPLDVNVVLARGAAFVAELEVTSGTWPVGTAISLVFSTSDDSVTPSGLTWPATVAGTTAAWDVAAADVTAVIAAGARYARLLYTEGAAAPLLWGKGEVRVA